MINSKEEFEKALKDEYWGTRRAAVRSIYFDTEHMSIALNDEDYDVRLATKLSITHSFIKNLDDLLIRTNVLI